MRKIVLVNGPPRSGKDSLGAFLKQRAPSFVHVDKFARILKESAHALYGLVDGLDRPLPHDAFEDSKEETHSCFYGLTPREAYQKVSEVYFKKVHGQEIFGRMLADSLERNQAPVVVLTDSGFVEEALCLISRFPDAEPLLVRLHREGYTFEGDTRGYIEPQGIAAVDIDSGGTLDEFRIRALRELVPLIWPNMLDHSHMAEVQLPGPSIQGGAPHWLEFAEGDHDYVLARAESARRSQYAGRLIRIIENVTQEARYVYPGDPPVYDFGQDD